MVPASHSKVDAFNSKVCTDYAAIGVPMRMGGLLYSIPAPFSAENLSFVRPWSPIKGQSCVN
jgi:hypothetical protein